MATMLCSVEYGGEHSAEGIIQMETLSDSFFVSANSTFLPQDKKDIRNKKEKRKI